MGCLFEQDRIFQALVFVSHRGRSQRTAVLHLGYIACFRTDWSKEIYSDTRLFGWK